MSTLLKICYHGTNKENAREILKNGFLPGTYFSQHLEDALGYGGGYIFEVVFPEDTTSEYGWQFTIPEHLPPEDIVKHYTLSERPIYENKLLRQRIFASHMDSQELEKKKKDKCDFCGKSHEGILWQDLWHMERGVVELCSEECVDNRKNLIGRLMAMGKHSFKKCWVSNDGLNFILTEPTSSVVMAERAVAIALQLTDEFGQCVHGSFEDNIDDGFVSSGYRRLF